MPKEESVWSPVFERKPGEKKYWLVKSEPDVFSFDDLQKSPKKTTGWNGVRNFTARNFLRDGMKKGDLVFFYHSSTKPQAIVGICEVAREAYPDPTATDPKNDAFDPKASADNPLWYMVDLRAVEALPRAVTLEEIKKTKSLAQMPLLRVSRLSVQPVGKAEWDAILAMAAKPS
jgi:predicted RNA-binding protein with PUA-like domain